MPRDRRPDEAPAHAKTRMSRELQEEITNIFSSLNTEQLTAVPFEFPNILAAHESRKERSIGLPDILTRDYLDAETYMRLLQMLLRSPSYEIKEAVITALYEISSTVDPQNRYHHLTVRTLLETLSLDHERHEQTEDNIFQLLNIECLAYVFVNTNLKYQVGILVRFTELLKLGNQKDHERLAELINHFLDRPEFRDGDFRKQVPQRFKNLREALANTIIELPTYNDTSLAPTKEIRHSSTSGRSRNGSSVTMNNMIHNPTIENLDRLLIIAESDESELIGGQFQLAQKLGLFAQVILRSAENNTLETSLSYVRTQLVDITIGLIDSPSATVAREAIQKIKSIAEVFPGYGEEILTECQWAIAEEKWGFEVEHLVANTIEVLKPEFGNRAVTV